MEELATTGTLHHFVPNVKFSRLQRSLKKIHSEELDSGKDTASLWSERTIFRSAQRATWTLGYSAS